ncbi:hypothetical protein DFH28DRAFT_941735 [Melampsora americana]|nr:hypothetical protein DFH28DRAFT_941735 [Melampsora americana]
MSQNLAQLENKFVKIIDSSSNSLELFLSLISVTEKRSLSYVVYHNIWSKWKYEKYPSAPEVSLQSFTKVLCGVTFPLIKSKPKSNLSAKVDESGLKVSRSSRLYSYTSSISDKGEECMMDFKYIFHNKGLYFEFLRKSMLDKLYMEQNNLNDYQLMKCERLLINAITVVKRSVVQGFFGIIKGLHENDDSDWNLELILKTGWEFFQHNLSLWETLHLDNLFMETGLSKLENQQEMNTELSFSAGTFHIAMKSSHSHRLSIQFVLFLLRNWAYSLPADQKDFKLFQAQLKHHAGIPFQHWF